MNRAIIVASIIIGLAILGYAYMDYTYKIKALEVKETQERQAEAQKTINKATEYEKRAKIEECQQDVRARIASVDLKGASNETGMAIIKFLRDELDNCIAVYK